MTDPFRTDSTKGWAVNRKVKNGHVHSYRIKGGLNTIGLMNVDVGALKELGALLQLIAKGGDARKIFGQNLRAKPRKTSEHMARSLAYWSMRALNPRRKDRVALNKARSILPGKALSDATIRKIAQRHRDWAIGFVSLGETFLPLKFEGGGTVKLRTRHQAEALKRHLAKKSSRPEQSYMDEFPT